LALPLQEVLHIGDSLAADFCGARAAGLQVPPGTSLLKVRSLMVFGATKGWLSAGTQVLSGTVLEMEIHPQLGERNTTNRTKGLFAFFCGFMFELQMGFGPGNSWEFEPHSSRVNFAADHFQGVIGFS